MSIMDFPFHPIADGQGAEDQCSRCFCDCREESIMAIKDVNGTLFYACPDCVEELKRDFEP